ncbi:MAG TPA: hypothetical protein PKV73_01140 [Agriterribacter sp.]|nr:hypothetical protein [Agriterribacter sp.]
MQYEEIYGAKCKIPEKPKHEDILNHDLPKDEQLWYRVDLPPFFEKVEYNKAGDLILTPQQEEYAAEEVRRCKQGLWIYINGVATFIPKKYYFYLAWWVLEDGSRPEYRDCDRRYFTFLEHWEGIQWCLGIIRGKKRREGASSQATANLIYECIFFKNSNCGLVSKSRDDSRDTFTEMVSFGYRQLPPFLKPKQLNKEDSVSELVFAQKSATIKEGVSTAMRSEEGHRSKVTYKAPVLNVYDRARLSRVVLDEFGKLEKDVPASQLFSVIAKTLIKGVKRLGFVEMPSTVNKMTKGGAEFKMIWENADLNKKIPTANRLVRYFTPAYDGYEGFIGKYGESIIDEPTEEQYQYLVSKWVSKDSEGNTISELTEEDIRLGCKIYITKKRREGLQGDLLEEEIRQNPCNEVELFMSANADCIFNVMNLNEQIEYLKEHPVYKRKIVYYRNLETQKVGWRDIQDNEKSKLYWEWVGDLNLAGQDNKWYFDGTMRKPGRADIGVIGVDGISSEQGGKKYGSKASAWVFIKFDLKDPENTGLFTAHLYGRPEEMKELYDQILLCAEYNGFIIYWEHVADAYFPYFKERGRLGYLAVYPRNAIAPEKLKREKVERHYGFPTTDFAISRGHDAMITYVLYYYRKIYWIELCEDLKVYDQNKRTPSDRSVSAMITLVGSLEPIRKPPPKKHPLINVYENQQSSKYN